MYTKYRCGAQLQKYYNDELHNNSLDITRSTPNTFIYQSHKSIYIIMTVLTSYIL